MAALDNPMEGNVVDTGGEVQGKGFLYFLSTRL